HGHWQAEFPSGADDRPGKGGQERRLGRGHGFARRIAIRANSQVASSGGRARRRHGLRRSLLRQESDAQHQARSVQAEFHAGAQWPDLNLAQGARMIDEESRDEKQEYYGKSRGIVMNTVAPDRRGRIQVIVADVPTLLPPTWAMPCLPVGGIQNGMFTVPPIGAGVWVEFEQGDPDYPIWVGCYW